MININIKNKMLPLCIVVIGVTSYVVVGQNAEEKVGKEQGTDTSVEVKNIENEIDDVNTEVEKTSQVMTVTKKSLEDIVINKDSNVPSEVGINASKVNYSKTKFPTIPGFKKTENDMSGILPNENKTEIYLMDLGDRYELVTTSEVLYDDVVKSYVEQILSYYKDKKYTSEISGAKAVYTIIK